MADLRWERRGTPSRRNDSRRKKRRPPPSWRSTSSKSGGSYDSEAAQPRGVVQHGRWLAGHCPGARSGRVQHVRLAPNSTAIAFDSARRRAPPSGGGRHCSAARAASSGDDLRRPTHCLTSPKGDLGASAMDCCHAPASARVRKQVSELFGARAIGRLALSRLCGERCRKTCCGAIVAAVHSFGTRQAHAGVTRCALPHASPCVPPLRPTPPPWHRL